MDRVREIERLSMEAGDAGDLLQVALCRIALGKGIASIPLTSDEHNEVSHISKQEAVDRCLAALRSAGSASGE